MLLNMSLSNAMTNMYKAFKPMVLFVLQVVHKNSQYQYMYYRSYFDKKHKTFVHCICKAHIYVMKIHYTKQSITNNIAV